MTFWEFFQYFVNHSNILWIHKIVELFIIYWNLSKVSSTTTTTTRTIFKLIGPCEITLTVKKILWSMCKKQVFHLFCSSIHEKWHLSLCCLCLFRVLDENFCNFEMRQLFFFFLFQQQCKYGKVSFSLGCYFFAIITWGTAQDWRSFCLNYFAAVVERKCIFPIGKRRRDLLITQSNFKRPLALLGWKW